MAVQEHEKDKKTDGWLRRARRLAVRPTTSRHARRLEANGSVQTIAPRAGLSTLLALLLVVMTTLPAFAGGGEGTVVAIGLANPRGLVVMPDGTLYVAEAGTSGDEAFQPPAPYPPSTTGTSGRVTRVAPDGTKTTVADELPSFSLGGNDAAFVFGPQGLASADGVLWLSSAAEAAIVRIDPKTGETTKESDLYAFEEANNPGGYEIDSGGYGLAFGEDGALYVADAGGNDLLRVDPDSGRVTLVTAFAGVPGPEPNPARGGKRERDPVPTGVALGPDGSFYVALLTGFPGVPGTSTVQRVTPDGATSEVVGGLTAATGVTFGPDGRLYVTEFGAFEKEGPADNGRILRVLADGTTEVVADELSSPNFPTFDAHGNLYVAVDSNSAPNDGTPGRVMRFDGVAPPGMPNTGAGGLAPGPTIPIGSAAAALTILIGGGYAVLRQR